MTSVGSVSIELSLDRSSFDKDLRNLGATNLKPLDLDIKLNGENLTNQIRRLTKDLDCIPLDICAHLDSKALKAEVAKTLESLQTDLQVQVRAAIDSTLKINTGSTGSKTTTSNEADKLQAKLEQGMERVALRLNEKIETAIESSIRNILNTAAAPFKSAFTGVFEGVGQNIGSVVSRGLISTFQKEAGVNLKNLGSQAGTALAGVVNDLRGDAKTKPQNTTRVGSSEYSFSPRSTQDKTKLLTNTSEVLPQGNPPTNTSIKIKRTTSTDGAEIKNLLNEFDKVSTALKDASKLLCKFGKGAFTAAEDALKLATALTKLYGALQSNVNNINSNSPKNQAVSNNNPTANRKASPKSSTGAQPCAPTNTNAHFAKNDPWSTPPPMVKGFLRGDKSTLTKEDAVRQVEATRMRLQKRLETLQQIPGGATSKQIGVLLNAIATIESRIAADIADPTLPTEVKRSLGQLRAVNSKLATTRRAFVAESARISAVNPQGVKARGGIGVAGKVLGAGLGATILGAGQSFASTGASSAGLGFLGALPFDPTLGLAAGGIAGALAAAKFAPKLIRKAGATKIADVLETNVNDLIKNVATGISGLFSRAKNQTHSLQVQARRKISSDIIIAHTRTEPNPKGLGNEVDNSSKFRPPRNITPPTLDPTITSNVQDTINTIFKTIVSNAKSTANNILNSLKIRKSPAADKGISTKDLGKKIDAINAQIDKITKQIQQDILKKTGTLLSLDEVQNLLKNKKYYDPRYAAASHQQQFLEKQYNRNYNETVENKERTSVNKLTGRRKLIADNDDIFKQLRENQAKIDAAARKAQQEILKETGELVRLSEVKKLLRSGARNNGDYTSASREKQQLVNTLREKERRAIAPMPASSSSPEKFWDNFFRGLEARFFRSPLFKNISPKDRRSLTSEATGFFTAGAAMIAPGATLAALSVPLVTALAPLITTIGVVANAIAPLVGTVTQTLKQIQPLEARLQYVSGSPQGVAENRSFIQGVAEQFNISNFTSLEQFSKLSAAVKGTRLEGEPLRELFKGIATAAKGLSLDTQDLNLVMFAFTQIASKGKLSAEEVRLQLAERFPGIVNILAKSLNVTTQEFNRMLESGSLIAEDVLPKLGKALQQEYGAAAVAASGNFLSALTKVENAIFKIKESVARGLAPIFGFVANTLGNAIGLIGQFADKLVPIFSVVLIGFAAQFFVGLTQVLEASGFIAKMQAFLIPLFSRLFVTLTPFAVGILADFLDDVVGAQTSVMDNLMKGAYNAVVTLILSVQQAQSAVSGFFSNLPKLPSSNGVSGLGDAFSGIGKVLKLLMGLVRGTGVEFVSLTLILAQTLVLAQGGLNLVLARFGVTIASLGTSFIAAAKSGALFKTTMSTLMAGLTPIQFAATAAAAALVLFFAKADLKDELGESFDKLESGISSNLDRIREALKETGKSADEFKKKLLDFKSKGFDLTVGLGEAFGGEAYRSDDLIKLLREFKGKQSPQSENFYGSLVQGLFGGHPLGIVARGGYDSFNKDTKTLAETFFENNLKRTKKDTTNAIRVVDESGLLNGKFGSNAAGKAVTEINQIDTKIKSLQKTRIDLLDSPDANSDVIKKQVANLDKQINEEIKKRSSAVKPIESTRDSILNNSELLKTELESINASSFPEAAKKQLRDALQPAIDKTEEAKTKLESLKLIDLSPLGNTFTEITKKIEQTDKALERATQKGQLLTLKNQKSITDQLASGKITPEQAQSETFKEDLRSLRARSQSLESFLKTRRNELKDLLAIPNPNPDQLGAIDKNRKEIEAKEIELAQNRLSISQKLVEGKKQAEERILRDFQRANTAASEAISKAETARLIQIKQRQLKGLITPEQANLEIAASSNTTAAKNLSEAKRQIAEFNRLKKTGKISDEEARNRDIELNRALADSNLKVVESQLAQQQELRNKEIRAIEERTQKHKNSSDLIISGIEQQKAAVDLLNASIERTKELEQSRYDLNKALSDAAISDKEIQLNAANQALDLSKRLSEQDLDPKLKSTIREQLSIAGFGSTELEILNQRQSIEADIANTKITALKTEQEFQRRSLELDLQRQRIVAQTAQYEAQIGVLRSQQSIVEAQAALNKANVSGNKLEIETAKIGLDIANRQLELSNKQLANSNQNLKIQDELAANAQAAQKATSEAAMNSAIAAENARRSAAVVEYSDAQSRQNKPKTEETKTPDVKSTEIQPTQPLKADTEDKKKEKPLGLLEQTRLNMSALLGVVTKKYLPPDQSGSIGLDRATSVESQLKRSLGLDPFESVENYLKRPRSIFFGGGGSYDELNLKYKPGTNNLQELQQKYKPLTQDFEELQQKYPNTTPGFNNFTQGLKEANYGIEQKLQALIDVTSKSANSPRNLYVSSPTPVSDAAAIWANIAHQSIINAGLG